MKTVTKKRVAMFLPATTLTKIETDASMLNLDRSVYIQLVLEGRLKVPKKQLTRNAHL